MTPLQLQNNLDKIKYWVFQKKMSLNHDSSKKPQEVIFTQVISNFYME